LKLQNILLLLSSADFVLLALSVVIFEVPRYTISLAALGLARTVQNRRPGEPPKHASVSVILPVFNGETGLQRSIASLRLQTLMPLEVIVVDDGSTDRTREIAEVARAAGDVDLIIHHGSRCGRSAAINAAARFAQGDLLLAIDPDTILDSRAIARLAEAFNDPSLAAASGNLGVSNERATLWTELQAVEYLMSISAGRSFLNHVDAISCCSGACSMYRRDVFMDQGGLDVGPGEDLEYTLRLRRLGNKVRFVPDAWAGTNVPETGMSLIRQRSRWDRDALRIRLVAYRELSLFRPFESLADTLQRLDFLVFDLVPAISFPFYMIYCVILFGTDTVLFLAGIYVLLTTLALFNMGLAYLLFSRVPSSFSVLVAFVFPFYQGIAMKLVRLIAFSSEILFSASRNDDYVPPRVRRALLGQPS
jgi:cellulose synthase/poly-beta-1,6-N-acetylglucosamine synthase-like glycosyltransferase